MTKVASALALALALVALTACSDARERIAERRATTTTLVALPEGRSTQTLSSGGVDRTFIVYAPPGEPTAPRPVVVNMHGFGSNAEQQLAYTAIEPIAQREGFIVIAPNGSGSPPHFDLYGTKDVEFITAAIDRVAAGTSIDRTRIYAMGMSNGAAMSAVLACRAGDQFAAIAPVAAIVYAENACDAAPPTAIIAFMGTDDRIVPFAGGTVQCCGNPEIESAPGAMEGWAAHNGCEAGATTEAVAADVDKQAWQKCTAGADTVFYVIKRGGHTWPGAVAIERLGNTTASIHATELIWQFFQAHERT